MCSSTARERSGASSPIQNLRARSLADASSLPLSPSSLDRRYGENLAASAGSGVTVQTALSGIKAWEAEAPDYNPAAPNYSHFTQMVWKASKQLGCYQASCPAGSIFDARYGVNSVRPSSSFLRTRRRRGAHASSPPSRSSSSASTTLLCVHPLIVH